MRKGISGYLSGQIALQTTSVLLVVTFIFLLEKAGGLASAALEAGATLAKVPYLLLLTAPQIIVYALPLALVIGVFRVFLRLREDGELVSMTNSGLRPAYFLVFAICLGTIGTIASVTASGFLEPLSRYAYRAELRLAFKEAIEKGMQRGQVRTIHGYVAATPNGTNGDQYAEMFVVDTNPATFQRLISSDRIVMNETADSGTYNVDLTNLRINTLEHTLPGPRQRPGKEDRLQVTKKAKQASIAADRYAHSLTLGELAVIAPRLERDDQRTLPELLPWFSAEADTNREQRFRGAKMILKGLLCLIAPLGAIIAVSLTKSANSMIILPAVTVGIFIFDILMVALAEFLSAAGLQPLIIAGLIELGAIVMISNIAYRFMKSGAFLKPSKSAF